MTERKYFGTDGIRGRVGMEPVTPETMLKLGWAVGRVLGDGSESKILIGKDTRISGYLLESALEAGLSAAGVNISLLGPMPTPGIAYLTRTSRAAAGIVISASHNPYHDNGIKFFSGDGLKLPDEVELCIEAEMDKPIQVVDSARLGKATRFSDASGRYIEYCKSVMPRKLSLKDVKVVLDCANGATYHIAPGVFSELGAQVVITGNQPDGLNINQNCGSTDVSNLSRLVKEQGADLGVAFDGDGDRVILVDAQGEKVDGDQILYILAMDRKRKAELQGGVVGTLMSNLGLEHGLAEEDIPFRRAKVGDRYVLSALQQEGWNLGGESSGHVICLERSTTGDGIIAALLVLEAMVEQQRPLDEIKRGMRIYPQTLINVDIPSQKIMRTTGDLEGCVELRDAVRRAEFELGDSGRVLLRPSGTEPVIRVMVEGKDEEQVLRIGRTLAEEVKIAPL